ncbi:MAG TPA: hypothetical protein VEP67_12770 [Thiobacillaceae bacterium]|nr:hypothetical protein [Thiobacillaceae bacterium]
MKFNSKVLASALLAAMGLIGIQTQAMANDEHNFPRWGYEGYQQNSRAMQESNRLAGQIDARQTRQHDRILEGLRSGELTQNEVFNLMQEQRGIRQQERLFLADGFLGPREFERLNQALNRADEHIRFEKHDQESRSGYPEPHPYGRPVPWSR